MYSLGVHTVDMSVGARYLAGVLKIASDPSLRNGSLPCTGGFKTAVSQHLRQTRNAKKVR